MRLHPPLPPPTPAPELPNVLSGPAITEPGAFILESRRNAGLEGDARTATDRARQAARRADPAVTNALKDSEWRAHHLIPLELIRNGHPVLKAALRAGWRTDEDANLAAVPNSAAAQKEPSQTGIKRPVDDSGHPQWNGRVRASWMTSSVN